MSYHYLYLLFLYYFNYKRDYYECHDVLEALWLDEARDLFFQGLLQVAVALYHFRWNNVKGAILLFEGAIEKLKQYPPVHHGIDVQKLRHECEEYLKKLQQYEQERISFYDLNIEIVDAELFALVKSIYEEMQ